MFEIPHFSIPAPRLSNHLTDNLGTVRGRLMPLITTDTTRGTGLGHVSGKTVQLTVLESVSRQEIILGGIGTILEFALHSYINTEWNNVLGPDVRISIVACVICITKSGDWVWDKKLAIDTDFVIKVTYVNNITMRHVSFLCCPSTVK